MDIRRIVKRNSKNPPSHKASEDKQNKNMTNNKSNKFLTGAIVGAVLGVISGILLAPESGKKMRSDIRAKSAEFYKFIAPKIKKIGKMGKKEYEIIVSQMAKNYAKAKKLSIPEMNQLVDSAKKHWNSFSKHL